VPKQILANLETMRDQLREEIIKDPRYLTFLALERSILDIRVALEGAGQVTRRIAAPVELFALANGGRAVHHNGGQAPTESPPSAAAQIAEALAATVAASDSHGPATAPAAEVVDAAGLSDLAMAIDPEGAASAGDDQSGLMSEIAADLQAAIEDNASEQDESEPSLVVVVEAGAEPDAGAELEAAIAEAVAESAATGEPSFVVLVEESDEVGAEETADESPDLSDQSAEFGSAEAIAASAEADQPILVVIVEPSADLSPPPVEAEAFAGLSPEIVAAPTSESSDGEPLVAVIVEASPELDMQALAGEPVEAAISAEAEVPVAGALAERAEVSEPTTVAIGEAPVEAPDTVGDPSITVVSLVEPDVATADVLAGDAMAAIAEQTAEPAMAPPAIDAVEAGEPPISEVAEPSVTESVSETPLAEPAAATAAPETSSDIEPTADAVVEIVSTEPVQLADVAAAQASAPVGPTEDAAATTEFVHAEPVADVDLATVPPSEPGSVEPAPKSAAVDASPPAEASPESPTVADMAPAEPPPDERAELAHGEAPSVSSAPDVPLEPATVEVADASSATVIAETTDGASPAMEPAASIADSGPSEAVGMTAADAVDPADVAESVSATEAVAPSGTPQAADVAAAPAPESHETHIEAPVDAPLVAVAESAPAPAIETVNPVESSDATTVSSGNGADPLAQVATADPAPVPPSVSHHDPIVAAEAEGAAWTTLQHALADVTTAKPNGDTTSEPAASSQAAEPTPPVEIAQVEPAAQETPRHV
jgi:hypothetical protein